MSYIFALTNIVSFTMLMIFHMHMFQLNSYNKIEEKTWIKENKYIILGRNLGVWISLFVLFIFSFKFKLAGIVIATILNIFTLLGNRPRKGSKIPLKYTKRVKRMIFTCYLIFAVIYLLAFEAMIFTSIPVLFFIIIQAALLFVPYLIMLSNLINKPIEKHINEKFINEAKVKINSMQNLTVIGVTGSYGKTSVKHILGKLLGKDHNVLITPGNFNTTLGVVITIREHLSPIHDIFVCEMGAKALGEIKEICDIVNPRYGIITSIGPQHLETFLSIENVVKTKFELADAIPDFGTVFLNYDNEYIRNNKIDKNVVTYAVDYDKADYVPFDLKVDENGSSFKLNIEGEDKPVEFRTNLLGKHNVLNIAGCIAVARKLNVSTETLVQRVRELDQIKHRQEIIKKDFGIIIDDAYNSNPSGAKAALDTLNMFDMTKIVITPGMIELGEKQYELNKQFGKQIPESADYIILVGKNQTKPIQDGIAETDFDSKKLFVVDDINSALSIAYSIKSKKQKAILLENDLPDNY